MTTNLFSAPKGSLKDRFMRIRKHLLVSKRNELHSKNKKSVLGNAVPVLGMKLGETKTRVVHILVIFQDRNPYHLKGLGESFSLMWLNIGLS